MQSVLKQRHHHTSAVSTHFLSLLSRNAWKQWYCDIESKARPTAAYQSRWSVGRCCCLLEETLQLIKTEHSRHPEKSLLYSRLWENKTPCQVKLSWSVTLVLSLVLPFVASVGGLGCLKHIFWMLRQWSIETLLSWEPSWFRAKLNSIWGVVTQTLHHVILCVQKLLMSDPVSPG